eukprot:SAG22_NODE_419_length_10742_cov_2.786902_2_plen_92_part_00
MRGEHRGSIHEPDGQLGHRFGWGDCLDCNNGDNSGYKFCYNRCRQPSSPSSLVHPPQETSNSCTSSAVNELALLTRCFPSRSSRVLCVAGC